MGAIKRLLRCSLFAGLALCIPARAQTRIEAVRGYYPNTANGTIQVNLGTSTTSGELIVVSYCVTNGVGSPAVTDSASQSYTNVFDSTVTGNSLTDHCGVYYTANSASGVTSVTCKEGASAGHGACVVTHYKGMAASSVVDQFSVFNAGQHSPWSSTAVTTTNANDVLIGLCLGARSSANSVPSVSGSWNQDDREASSGNWDGNNGNGGLFSYQILGSTGGYQDTGTDTGGSGVTDKSAIVAFKGASGGGVSTFSLSGTVSPVPAGSGVLVSVAGPSGTSSATTNSSGAYTISGLANATYTVTPSKSGATFSPSSLGVTINSVNASNNNFTIQTYSISGLISGGAGATVTLSGTASATVTADPSGNYVFNGLLNGSYTVAPAASGLTFSPASQAVALSGTSATNANFAALYSISGTVTGGSGATVTLSGGASATTMANGSGNYTFSGLSSGSYTIAVSETGSTFSPATQNVPVNGANVTGVNFAIVTYSITGTVTGGSNATVALSGAASATTTADASGNYAFSGLLNGTYTVSPTKVGSTFSPTNQTVTISGADLTNVSFVSLYSISGTITGGSAATVALTSTTVNTTTTADGSGNYTFTGLGSGAYTVTPSESSFTFTPASQTVTIASAGITGLNFAVVTYSISGTITGPSGATVALSGAASATTTADASGNYTFNGLYNGTYTVTPNETGFTFSPGSLSVTISSQSASAINFSAPTYSISGTVTGASGTTLTLSGTSSATVTADGSGNYTFNGLPNGSFTVVPSQSGFSFSPLSQAVTINSADVIAVNFAATVSVTIAIDATAFGDSTKASSRVTSAAFSTSAGNELLLAMVGAYVSTSSGTNNSVASVSGGGLTWVLVKRTNVQRGTAEIWRAFASAPLTNVTVRANLAISAVSSITVMSFTGVNTSGTNGSGAVGNTGSGNGSTGSPTASLVTLGNNSLVLGVGEDWNATPSVTVGPNQILIHQLALTNVATFWMQRQTATTPTSGTTVIINDTVPTNQVYNSAICEILAGGDNYIISGTISPATGGAGATVAMTGTATASTVTTGTGTYAFSGLSDGVYTLTPSNVGYVFSPSNQVVTVRGASVPNENFTAVPLGQTYSISGTVTSSGAGATMTLSGAANATVTADSSGAYSFSGLFNGTYTVTPSETGFAFSPSSQTLTINGTSAQNISFTATVSPVTVTISPTSAALTANGTKQFTGTVTGSTNTAVTWFANGGTISANGLYTAPTTVGTFLVTATSVADPTKSASATVTVAASGSTDVLLGDQNLESQLGSVPLGQAEAFQAGAGITGNVESIAIYLDSTSSVSQLVLGLYNDNSGHPGTLLSQGSSTQLTHGSWNTIPVQPTAVAAGKPYWIAILGATGGTLVYRHNTAGGCSSETSAQISLSSLPSTWTTGAPTSDCRASVFGSWPWVVLNRPGDGSNSEQENYQLYNTATNAGFLTLTEQKDPNNVATGVYLSGDVPTGSYISCTLLSGNNYNCTSQYSSAFVQWATFNQQYGDFQIRAKLGYGWPTIWMMGKNCQGTMPITPSSINGCDWDYPGSEEIDISEGSSVSAGATQISHSLHTSATNYTCYTSSLTDVTKNYHVYEAVVTSNKITWFVDGVQSCSTSNSNTDYWFLMINQAIGGNLGGNPASFAYPNSTSVDWVKVCASTCSNGIVGASAPDVTFFDDFTSATSP